MKSARVYLIALAAIISALLSTNIQAQQASLSPFSGINYAHQISGPKISPDSLRGKVVFVEYWGTRCGPCRQSMPHLQSIYNQFGNTGLFCIIGNHIQQYSPDTDRFLKQTGVTFPVYQELNLPINKRITSIPRAFLFDVSGKLIAEGHPNDVVNMIPTLVQQASLMKRAETLNAMNSSAPSNGDRQVVNSNINNFKKTALAMFTPDKPWQENYKQLQKTAQFNKKFESKALPARSDSHNTEALRLIELAKTEPAKAYASIVELKRLNNGANQNQAIEDVFKTLSADPNVKDLSDILLKISALDSQVEKMTQVEVKDAAQSLFLSLKAYYYRNGVSQELKKETFMAARNLKQKYGCSGKKAVMKLSESKVNIK